MIEEDIEMGRVKALIPVLKQLQEESQLPRPEGPVRVRTRTDRRGFLA